MQLIKQGRVVPAHSEELDAIMSTSAAEAKKLLPKPEPTEEEAAEASKQQEQQQPSAAAQAEAEVKAEAEAEAEAVAEAKAAAEDERMILQPHHVDLLLHRFNLDRQAGIDLRRAREQTLSHLHQTALEAQSKAQAPQSQEAGQQPPKEVKVSAAARHTLEELERTADAADKMLGN